jgi:HEAT repeat protein
MKPIYWMIVIAGAALAGAWHVRQKPNSPAGEQEIALPATAAPATGPVAISASTPMPETAAAPDQVARWLEDLNSADAAQRNAAIRALATAPREQALPALRNVLTSGEHADRPQAVNSLRELALGQGDADGRVREIIREVIYHGDDEALAMQAQDALDVVEESEMK